MMPPPKTRRFRSIVCAVDVSPSSAMALRYGVALAAACGGAVTAVFAVDPLLSNSVATAYDPHLLERDAMRDLTRFVHVTLGARAAGAVRCVIGVGKAGAVIVDRARTCHADVVVVGTNGRRGARKLFFGSTSEAVLRRSRAPVLVVPPRAPRPGRDWPSGYIAAAVGQDIYRRAEIGAAARMAEAFGAFLSIVPVTGEQAPGGPRTQMIIYPLPRAERLRMFRQGSVDSTFICGARAPVLVIPTGRTPVALMRVPPRAA